MSQRKPTVIVELSTSQNVQRQTKNWDEFDDEDCPPLNVSEQIITNSPKIEKSSNKMMNKLPDNKPFKLKIRNVPLTANDKDVEMFFYPMKPIHIKMISDRNAKSHRGFGFIEFETKEDLSKAIEYNSLKLKGQSVAIEIVPQVNVNYERNFDNKSRSIAGDSQVQKTTSVAQESTNWRSKIRENVTTPSKNVDVNNDSIEPNDEHTQGEKESTLASEETKTTGGEDLNNDDDGSFQVMTSRRHQNSTQRQIHNGGPKNRMNHQENIRRGRGGFHNIRHPATQPAATSGVASTATVVQEVDNGTAPNTSNASRLVPAPAPPVNAWSTGRLFGGPPPSSATKGEVASLVKESHHISSESPAVCISSTSSSNKLVNQAPIVATSLSTSTATPISMTSSSSIRPSYCSVAKSKLKEEIHHEKVETCLLLPSPPTDHHGTTSGPAQEQPVSLPVDNNSKNETISIEGSTQQFDSLVKQEEIKSKSVILSLKTGHVVSENGVPLRPAVEESFVDSSGRRLDRREGAVVSISRSDHASSNSGRSTRYERHDQENHDYTRGGSNFRGRRQFRGNNETRFAGGYRKRNPMETEEQDKRRKEIADH